MLYAVAWKLRKVRGWKEAWKLLCDDRSVDWASDRAVNSVREEAGIDELVIVVVHEEGALKTRAIVLGLAADDAKPELLPAFRSIILNCQLSTSRYPKAAVNRSIE